MKKISLKKKIISLMLVVAMVASSLPGGIISHAYANPSESQGTVTNVGNWQEFENALKGDADVIKFTQNISSPQGQGDAPILIKRNVIIDGSNCEFTINHGGILQGGDITLQNIKINLTNPVRNMIIANGHSLTLDNVISTGAQPINVVAGYIVDPQANYEVSKGNGGSLSFKGKIDLGSKSANNPYVPGQTQKIEHFGSVFIGSVSDAANKDKVTQGIYDKDTIVNIDIANTKTKGFSVGGFFSAGGREQRGGFGNETIVVDKDKFKVTGNVTYYLHNGYNMTFDGETGGNKNAVLYYTSQLDSPLIPENLNQTVQLKDFEEINVLEGSFEPKQYMKQVCIDGTQIIDGLSSVALKNEKGNILKPNGNLFVAENSILSIRNNKALPEIDLTDVSIGNINGAGKIIINKIKDKEKSSPAQYQQTIINGNIQNTIKVDAYKNSSNGTNATKAAIEPSGNWIFKAINSTDSSFILESESNGKNYTLQKYAIDGNDGFWKIATPNPSPGPEGGEVPEPQPAEKQDVTIEANGAQAKNAVYNGQAITGYTGTPKVQGVESFNEFEIKYKGILADGKNTPYQETTQKPTQAGSYTVTFGIPEDNPNYKCTNPLTLSFEISKKPLQYVTSGLTATKQYDKKTSAATITGDLTVNGLISEDGVVFNHSGLSHNGFENANVHTESVDLIINTARLEGLKAFNYALPSAPQITASITKADAKSLEKKVELTDDKTQLTVNGLGDLMGDKNANISGYEVGKVTGNDKTVVSDIVASQNGTLTATIASAKAGEVVTIPITVTSGNYKDSLINVIVTIKESSKPTPPAPTPGGGSGGGGDSSGGGGSVTPPPTPGGGSGGQSGGGSGGGSVAPPKPENPEKPETPNSHTVVTPTLPSEPPKEGANVGMDKEQSHKTNTTLKEIISGILNPETKPEPPIDPDKPQVPQTQAEKETAETKKEIVKAGNDSIITVDVKADKIDIPTKPETMPDKLKVELNAIKETVNKNFEQAGTKFLQFADIYVVAKANKDGVSRDLGYLRNLDKELEFTFEIPASDEGKNLVVVRYHDGVAEIIPSKTVGNKVTFTTSKFSTYALVEYHKVLEPKPEKPAKPSKPQNVKVMTDYGLIKVTAEKTDGVNYRFACRELGTKAWTYINTKDNEVVIKDINGKDLKKNARYEIRVALVDSHSNVRSDYDITGAFYTNRSGNKSGNMFQSRIEKATTKNGSVTLTARNIKYKSAPQTVKYKFAYKVKGSKKWTYTKFSPSNVKTIKGLKKGKTYTFATAYGYKSAVDNETYVYSKYAYKDVRVK